MSSDTWNGDPVHVDSISCPECGGTSLTVRGRLEMVGYATVAGVQVKASAVMVPWLSCDSHACDFEVRAKR